MTFSNVTFIVSFNTHGAQVAFIETIYMRYFELQGPKLWKYSTVKCGYHIYEVQ